MVGKEKSRYVGRLQGRNESRLLFELGLTMDTFPSLLQSCLYDCIHKLCINSWKNVFLFKNKKKYIFIKPPDIMFSPFTLFILSL